MLYNKELICEWMARFKVSNTFELSGMQGSVEQWSFAYIVLIVTFLYYEVPTKLVTRKE